MAESSQEVGRCCAADRNERAARVAEVCHVTDVAARVLVTGACLHFSPQTPRHIATPCPDAGEGCLCSRRETGIGERK